MRVGVYSGELWGGMRIGHMSDSPHLLQQLKDNNVKMVETPRIKITVKDSYVQSKVDSKRLKEELPDVYAKYLKESRVAESLTIKMKGEQKDAQ